MSSIHYKFKSALTYDTITFDGLHISVKDLKKAILQQKQIGKTTDFDLQITNAQTNEVYVDENALIAKNSSLIIVRVPLSAQQKRAWERAEANQQLPGVKSGSAINFDGQDPEAQKLAKAIDLSSLDASEDDKILAMMTQSTLDYDPVNYMRIRGSNQVGEVPSNYRCYKCHLPGHWIKDCRLNASQESTLEIRKSTGIPRSFMVPVEGPSVPGAMMTPTGQFAVPQIDHQAYQEAGSRRQPPQEEPAVEKPAIPDDLLCSICQDLLTDAVMIPCCGNSFCDDCIRNVLLESDNHQCPDCKECSVSPDTLIPNRFLRNAVNNFKNQTGYHGRSVSNTSAPQSQRTLPTTETNQQRVQQGQQPHQFSHHPQPQQHQQQLQQSHPQQMPSQSQQGAMHPTLGSSHGMIDHGRVQNSGSRPSSAEHQDRRHMHPPHSGHPIHATAPQSTVQSANISVLSPAEPAQGPLHPPPPGNIHSHSGAGQPIHTIGSGRSRPFNPNRSDSVDIVEINDCASSANGPSKGHPRSHMPSRPPTQPNNPPRFPIPTTDSKFDHNAPPGVEDGPSLRGGTGAGGQHPEGVQKHAPGILSQSHRGAMEERSGTPTVDEQASSAAGSTMPDTSQPPPQQPVYQIPSFPLSNRPPHYSQGYGPMPGMPPHGYPPQGPMMHPYGGIPPYGQGYPMDNSSVRDGKTWTQNSSFPYLLSRPVLGQSLWYFSSWLQRGGARMRGYTRGRPPRGMHPTYRGVPPNGNQVGIIEDPLAAFQKMLQEKDSRDKHLRRRRRSFSRSHSKSPQARRRSRSRSFRRSISRSKSRSRTRSRSRSRSGSPRSRSRTPPPAPRSRSLSRSRSRTPRTPPRSRTRSISVRRSRTRTPHARSPRSRSRTPRSRTRTRSRSRSVRVRSKTPPVPKKKKARSRSHSASYSFSLSRSRSRSLSRSLSPRDRDRDKDRDRDRDIERDRDREKDRRYSPHRRGSSRYRTPPPVRSPPRYVTRYNKDLDAVLSYHEQPEYGHRGYYRGRGRGRYQSVVRKAIGRTGPPGSSGVDGPPSYYSADSYSTNRYTGDGHGRYDQNHGGRYHHQQGPPPMSNRTDIMGGSQQRYNQRRYDQYEVAPPGTGPDIPSVATYRSNYQDDYIQPPGVAEHRVVREHRGDLAYQGSQRDNVRELVARDWERTRDRELEQRERERARDYEDRYGYPSSKRQQSISPRSERHHRRSRERGKENKPHPVEALEASHRDVDYDAKNDSRNRVLLDIKKEPSIEKEKKKDKDRDVDSSPVKEKKRDKEKKKKKKDVDVEKKKKKKKERKEGLVKVKYEDKEDLKISVSFDSQNVNPEQVKTEPSVDPLYGDLEGTRIDQNVVENYVKVTEGEPSNIDSSVIQIIEPTETAGDKQSDENTIKENVMLAPVPELSKWELDEDLQSTEEKSGGETGSNAGDKKVVTSEVLKRAENVIFQKAVNAIRPFDLKRSSDKSEKSKEKKESSPMSEVASTGLDSSREARKAGNSIQVTIPSVPAKPTERSVEATIIVDADSLQNNAASKPKLDRSKFASSVTHPVSPVRVSAKERLGAKIDDYERSFDDVKRVRSAVERKSRSHSPKKFIESRKSGELIKERHKERDRSPSRERRVIVGSLWGNRPEGRERPERRFFEDGHKERRHRDRERDRDRKQRERRSRSSSHDKRVRRERKHSEKSVVKKVDEKSKTEDKKPITSVQKKEELERKVRKNPRLSSDKRKPPLDEASFEPDYDETSSPESEPEVPGEEKNLLINLPSKSGSPAKKRSRSVSIDDKGDQKKVKPETVSDLPSEKTLKHDVEKIAKRIEIDSAESSDTDSSSDSSSDSSVEVRKKRKKKRSKKKKKKNRKKRKDSSSESESSESSSSDSETEKSKKRKHKHRNKKTKSKKRKKNKHK